MESVFKKDGTSIGIITLSDIKNVPITDIFQINGSYTITTSQVFKIGEYYDVWMTVRKNSGYFGTVDETIGKFKRTVDIYNIYYGCFDSYSEWGIWEYRRWDNGMRECWGTWSGTINLGENNYSGFQYSNAQQISLPSGLFTSPPMFWVDMGPTSYMALCRAFSRTTTWVRFVCAGHTNVSQSGVNVFLYCQGW